MDKNMKKWLQTETGSQTGAFTLFHSYWELRKRGEKNARCDADAS